MNIRAKAVSIMPQSAIMRSSRGSLPLASLMKRNFSMSPLPKGPDGRNIAIAFDIDGVLLRSGMPIGGSKQALRLVTSTQHGGDHPVGVPYVFLTNGSGMTEAQKAEQLQSRLGIYVPPSKVILAHSPLHQYSLPSLHQKILLVGMNKIHDVGTSFGFAKDRFLTPKRLIEQLRSLPTERARQELSASIDAIVVITDSTDWETDVGACAHVIHSHVMLQKEQRSADASATYTLPQFYSCNYDWVFSADCDIPRMAGGSFTSTILDVAQQYSPDVDFSKYLPIHYLGKPFPGTYRYAESIISHQLVASVVAAPESTSWLDHYSIYAFGDNPAADLLGANDAGKPWISCAVQTGTIPIVSDKLIERMRPEYNFKDVLQGVEFLLGE